MRTYLFFMIVTLFSFSLTGQEIVDSISYGDNSIEWQVWETDAPVIAVTATTAQIWYSTGTVVGTYDRKTNTKRHYPKLGTISSKGISSITSNPKTGAVWLAGLEGVAVFNGGKFKSYTTEQGIVDNSVVSILATKSGVWIATEKGVSCFANGAWKCYTEIDGLSGNSVRDITEDDQGGIWFATNKGVSHFSSGTWQKFGVNEGLSWNDAKAINFDSRLGVLWVAVGELDVNSYDGKEWSEYMDIQMGIQTIMSDTQSRIWFGSATGVIKYNGSEWLNTPAQVGFPAAQVLDMYKDGNGNLYFAIENGILNMKNPYPY